MTPSTTRRFALAIATFAVVAILPNPANAQGAINYETELVKVSNVSLMSAHSVAATVCQNEHREDRRCDVQTLRDEKTLAITSTATALAEIRLLLAELDEVPETRAFHIVVLSASRDSAVSADVPEAARQALQDVRDFLPYRGFSVLGSGWLRTSGYGTTTLPGPEEFIAQLEFRPISDASSPLLIEEFMLYRQTPITTAVEGETTTSFARLSVLQTTFTINRGETVVVGTSKLDGDALIVLLTAVEN